MGGGHDFRGPEHVNSSRYVVPAGRPSVFLNRTRYYCNLSSPLAASPLFLLYPTSEPEAFRLLESNFSVRMHMTSFIVESAMARVYAAVPTWHKLHVCKTGVHTVGPRMEISRVSFIPNCIGTRNSTRTHIQAKPSHSLSLLFLPSCIRT